METRRTFFGQIFAALLAWFGFAPKLEAVADETVDSDADYWRQRFLSEWQHSSELYRDHHKRDEALRAVCHSLKMILPAESHQALASAIWCHETGIAPRENFDGVHMPVDAKALLSIYERLSELLYLGHNPDAFVSEKDLPDGIDKKLSTDCIVDEGQCYPAVPGAEQELEKYRQGQEEHWRKQGWA